MEQKIRERVHLDNSDKEDIYRMFEANHTTKEIAEYLSCSTSTVRKTIIKRYGTGVILRYAQRHNLWTAEMDAKVMQMWNDGRTLHEIGKAVGRTKDAVSSHMHVMRNNGYNLKRRSNCYAKDKSLIQFL